MSATASRPGMKALESSISYYWRLLFVNPIPYAIRMGTGGNNKYEKDAFIMLRGKRTPTIIESFSWMVVAHDRVPSHSHSFPPPP